MRKTFGAALAALVLCGSMLAGCSGGQAASEDTAQAAGDGRLEVVCTTWPAYDWVREVAGDDFGDLDVTYLMDDGVDLHNFQPTVEDMATIADADLIIYVGGESDEWVHDALATASPDLRSLSLIDAVGDAVVEEEVVEGMEAEEEEEAEAEGEEEGPEYDEHVWLSLRRAETLVSSIAGVLGEIDAAHATDYATNAEAYGRRLAELEGRYEDMVAHATHDTVVFADRFPFRYLADDLGLTYYAAFVGCSAETEASFSTVTFLASKVDELGLDAVLVIEGSDRKIADTVVANTRNKDQEILLMDSLQSVTSGDVASGKTYLASMEDNLQVLSEALGASRQ